MPSKIEYAVIQMSDCRVGYLDDGKLVSSYVSPCGKLWIPVTVKYIHPNCYIVTEEGYYVPEVHIKWCSIVDRVEPRDITLSSAIRIYDSPSHLAATDSYWHVGKTARLSGCVVQCDGEIYYEMLLGGRTWWVKNVVTAPCLAEMV